MVRVKAGQQDLHRIGGLDQQLGTQQLGIHTSAMATVGDITRIGIADVGVVAVGLAIAGGHAESDLVVDQRRGDVALDLHIAERAVAERGIALGLHAGRLGEHLNGAAGGVAAEQRALRTLQHFNPLHIGKVEVVHGGFRLINAVEIDGDVVISTRAGDGRGDAADGGNGEVTDAVDPQARRDVAQRNRVNNAGLGKLRAVQGGDRNRHVAGKLRLALCGHDDVTGVCAGGGRGLVSGGWSVVGECRAGVSQN